MIKYNKNIIKKMNKYIKKELEKRNVFKDNSNKIKNHISKIIEKELPYVKDHDKYFNSLKLSLDMYYENIDLLKGYLNLDKDNEYYFNILDKYQKSNMFFYEHLSDKVVKISEYNNTLKYAKSFLRSYSHLMDNETIEKFRFIKSKNISRESIQNDLRKIASFRTSKELNSSLSKIIENIKINKEDIIQKIEDENINAEITYDSGDKLIVKINDFEASQKLGSSQWCISYNEYDYDNYLSYDDELISDLDNYDDCYDRNNLDDSYLSTHVLGSHFFVWDFNKNPDDPESLIAFTVKPNGSISDAHDKNDKSLFSSSSSIMLILEKGIIDSINFYIKNIKKEAQNHINPSKIIDNPINLIFNSPFPIVSYYELLKDKSEEDLRTYMLQVKEINIPTKLLELTEVNYENFNYDNKHELINSIIWFSNHIDLFKSFENEYSFDIDEYEDDYYNDESYNPKFDFNIGYENKNEVIKNEFIYKIINDMSESERFLLFKDKKIINLLKERATIDTFKNDEFIEVLANNYETLKDIKFRDFDKDDLLKLSKKIKIDKVKKKINKINLLDKEESLLLSNLINRNNDYIKSLSLNSIDSIINIIDNKIFLDNLNDKTLYNISKEINKNLEIEVIFDKQRIKKLKSSKLEESGFGDVFNKMYRIGFITKNFIDNLDINSLPKYIQDDYPSDYKNLKDYISSGKTIYQKKKQFQLI